MEIGAAVAERVLWGKEDAGSIILSFNGTLEICYFRESSRP